MSSPPHTPWIAFRRERPATRLRLFCLPYGGGSASVYRPWADELPADVEVCPVQLPGRETRFKEPPALAAPPLVAEMAAALAPFLDLPFALFGHSMGSFLAFELGRALEAQGRKPLRLFASGHPAPHLPRRRPLISGLPREGFVAALRDVYGVAPMILDDSVLMEMLYPLLLADYTVVESYRYAERGKLGCPITVFGGAEDPETLPEELAAWSEETTAGTRVATFSGDHMFLHPNRSGLLREIERDLRATGLLA